MEVEPDNISLDLGDVFPIQLRQKKTDASANQYLQAVTAYMNDISNKKHILDTNDLELIRQKTPLFSQYQFAFFEDYGSILIMREQDPFKPLQIGILFFKELSLNAFTDKEMSTEHVQSPREVQYYEIQKLSCEDPYFVQLPQLISKVDENLKGLKSHQKQQKTPSVLKIVVQRSLQQMIGTVTNAEWGVSLEKSGGTNFNSIVFPEVKHQFCYLIFSFILGNKKVARVLLLSFKLDFLYTKIEEGSLEANALKQCLRHLIVKFKQIYNQEILSNKGQAQTLFNELNKKIEAMHYQSHKSRAVSALSVNQSLADQKQFERSQPIKGVVEYCGFKSVKLMRPQSIGFTLNLGFGRERPFSELNKLYSTLIDKQNGEYCWVLLFEKCLFGLASQLNDLQVHPSEVCVKRREEQSVLQQILTFYEFIMTRVGKNGEYAFKLKNQAYSHVYLIKYIAAAVSFELLKAVLKKEQPQFDSEGYSIELPVRALYENFTSLDFQARRAIENLEEYAFSNKGKPILFSLSTNQNHNVHLKKLAKVYSENAECKNYLTNLNKKILMKIGELNRLFVDFNFRFERKQQQIQRIINQQCSCTYDPDLIYIIRCLRCISLAKANRQLQQMKQETFESILAQIPKDQQEQNMFAFFQHLRLSMVGAIKVIYQAQIPITNKTPFSKGNNKLKSLSLLNPYSQTKKSQRIKFYLNSEANSAWKFVVYQDPLVIYYYNYSSPQPIDTEFLSAEAKPAYSKLQWMVNRSDPSNRLREHMVYSNLDKKTALKISEFDHITMEQFKEYGSLRTCYRTELAMLAQGILSRKISPTTIKPHQFQRLITLNACGNIASFKVYAQNQTLQAEEISLIRQSIQHLLQNYLSKWKFQDFYALEIIGRVLSLLAMLVNAPSLLIGIIKRAFEEYEKIKQQSINKTDPELRLRELYLLHSIMACFSQNITEDIEFKEKSCTIFAKIMVNVRLNKHFVNSKNAGKKEYSQIVKQYSNYFQQSVLKNIHSVVSHFVAHPMQLTEVVRDVDKDISKQSNWQNVGHENYVFKCQSGPNTYQINLFQGIVLKNGTEANQLLEQIKNNQYFIEIFGKNAYLQVLQQKNGSFRSRFDYHSYFSQQGETQVFFQFYISGRDELKIRMIMKNKEAQQQCFLLVPHEFLRIENIYIPQLYLKHYQCWIDQAKHHLIFRERKLETMNKIGLILMHKIRFSQLLDAEESIMDVKEVDEGRIISKQFQQEPLSRLLEQDHQDYFQQLLVTDKSHVANMAIEVLSAIEDPKYIIQIYSRGRKKKTVFWLHRCDLRFTLDEKFGLVSQNFQGYAIDQQYRHHELLPWRNVENVRCLILKKYENSLRSASLHEFMLLLPNLTIHKGGSVKIPEGQIANNGIFSYEIHDNFKDIRSKNRLSQMHLCCLIASLSSSFAFKTLMVSSEEYCISVIRSCYSNNELSLQQCKKFLNLMSLCVEMNLNTLILCCDVLNKISSSLTKVYAQQLQIYKQLVQPFLKQKQQLIKRCKLIYRKRYEKGLVSTFGSLNKFELNVLGVSQASLKQTKRKQRLTRWFEKEFYSPQITQKIVKGLQQAVYQPFKKMQKDIQHLKATIMTVQRQKQIEPNKFFKPSMRALDALAKEMQQDMESSCQSYQKYSQKYERIQINKLQHLSKKFIQPKQKCQKLKKDLSKYLQKIHPKASEHLDMIVGYRAVAEVKCYTEIICKPQLIYEYYPTINKQNHQVIFQAIREWMKITVQIESLSRVLLLLGQNNIDKIALFRELQSPRKEISEKDYWICFEAEMKIRIWCSQYDTYKHLRDSNSGAVSQLNMGEGKTQVIIPMIVLDNIYGKGRGNPISRINILSQLFKEAEANYFRFFSVTSFRIPIFSLHFTREVQLTKENVYRMKFAIHLLRDKMLMLLDRESCLSMVLKVREDCLKENSFVNEIGRNRDHWLFDADSVYDIFDQVDALMTCKKSFVYSIGASSELQDSRIRFEYCRIVLEIVCNELFERLISQNVAVIEQTYEVALESIRRGGFPRGFRLKKNLKPEELSQIRRQIVKVLLNDSRYRPPQFQFCKNLQNSQKQTLITFLTDETVNDLSQIEQSLPKDRNQILAIRGLIAFHVLEHCLTMRNGVDFGVPCEQHPKAVGVPYEAADVPSKRSEFSHPDVAIIVSYISYFGKGLTLQQFSDCLHLLMKRSESVKSCNYGLWFDIIEDQGFKPSDVQQFQQINIDSQAQIESLYEKYKFNRNTVVFWLINKVFEKDLRQYTSSITSSSWDISYVDKSIGFSGTKDTRWLFPNYLQWSPSPNDNINGTDGKMIYEMLRSTIDIFVIEGGKESLWERFCQKVLDLQDDQVGCIIDAGAILVGKSFEKEIVPWIVKNRRFNKEKFKGVTFCDENGKWKVYDTVTLSVVERGTSIPEHDTFVIFDEARTRGADIKMGTNVHAVVSLSPTMTKDKLMQAVGRLRKFGRNQEIYIMGTAQAFEKIEKVQDKYTVEKVIEWACENSVSQNRNMQFPNSRLAQIHYKTVLESVPDVQVFDSSLKSLYSGTITEKSVYDICQTSINQKFRQEHIKSKQLQLLISKIKMYGEQHKVKSFEFQDVCEREVEFIVQTEKIIEHQYDELSPIAQDDKIEVHTGEISTLSFKFDKKLKFSKNFINCTKPDKFVHSVKKQQLNQLCNINFFLWQKNQFIIITQRQMTLEINKQTRNYGRKSLKQLQDFQNRFVGRFKDLKKNIPFVRANDLANTLIQSQFFNGKSQFKDEESRQILVELIKKSIKGNQASFSLDFSTNSFLSSTKSQSKELQKTSNAADSNRQFSLQQIICHFLKRRRIFSSKFLKSDLQKIMVQLQNLPERQFYQS